MRSIFRQFLQQFKSVYGKIVLKLDPLIRWIATKNAQIDLYFSTRPRARKWVVRLAYVTGPPTFILFILLFTVWLETPSRRAIRNIQNQVASEIYSADSVLLGRYFIQDRTEVQYEEIAPVLIDALVATEDVRFYDHSGIDYQSLGRVIIKSGVMQDESAGGGSTITQQLAKNLYPRKRYWILSMLINKLREVKTARTLERIYSKEEILTLYLNTVPFSDNVYGIEAAAQRFFSVSAKHLTIDQAALLIGTLKATHSYNPRLFPDRALGRRGVVFSQLVKYNFLSSDKVDSLNALPLDLRYNKVSHHHGLAPYFREVLKAELMQWCERHTKPDGSPYNIYTDGLKIFTTINSTLQGYAEKAVAQQMEEIQKQFYDHWGKDKPWRGREYILEDAIHRSSRYQKLKANGLAEEKIMEELQQPIPMKLFTWKGEQEVVVSPIDSIIHHLQFLNVGFVVMEPTSGKVLAWVGGIEHDFFQYDHVKISTKRQVGSIFKPIVFAMAVENKIAPCDFVSASQQTYIDDEGEEWTPRNGQNDYKVSYSMPGALAYSVNTVSVKLIQQAGVENTIALAKRMGISSEIPTVPSIALGSTSVSLFEMATAYSCLANEGVATKPYYIASIRDVNGNEINDLAPKESGQRVMSKETAQLVRHMMQTVMSEGTASRMRYRYGVYNDMGGKTGTTQSNADGWFMGITPTLVMGAWVGADDPRIRFRYTSLGQGSNTALPVAAYFMQQLNRDKSFQKISQAKFPFLSNELLQRLDCDLYELDDELTVEIEKMIHHRDSLMLVKLQIMQVDSLAADTIVVPSESYLEQLYKRKNRIEAANDERDDTDWTNAFSWRWC